MSRMAGILAHIAMTGVFWNFPPKGINTVFPPTVESNLSESPRPEHVLSSLRHSGNFEAVTFAVDLGLTFTVMCREAPLVLMKALEMFTVSFPRQNIRILPESLTFAITVASTSSESARDFTRSTFSGEITTAIRSCDSLTAISVPSSPEYFSGTASRFTSSPSANSPTATLTPPAPKSLHRLISLVNSGLRNNRCNLRSSGAFPFWTSAPQVSIDDAVCETDEPVAPPIPSLPVLPPRSNTMSPETGFSRITSSSFTAAITAPISRRLAM